MCVKGFTRRKAFQCILCLFIPILHRQERVHERRNRKEGNTRCSSDETVFADLFLAACVDGYNIQKYNVKTQRNPLSNPALFEDSIQLEMQLKFFKLYIPHTNTHKLHPIQSSIVHTLNSSLILCVYWLKDIPQILIACKLLLTSYHPL